MKLNLSTAPGYPTRGFMRHVPMSPEGDAGAGEGQQQQQATQQEVKTEGQQEGQQQQQATQQEVKTEDDPKALMAQLAAERALFATKSAELDRVLGEAKTGLAKERATERREFIRGMALAVPLTDEQLDRQLAGLGDVDARTDAGKAALNKFREDNSTLFRGPRPAPVLDPDKVIEEVCGGKDNVGRQLFGGRAAKSMITATKRSVFADRGE